MKFNDLFTGKTGAVVNLLAVIKYAIIEVVDLIKKIKKGKKNGK